MPTPRFPSRLSSVASLLLLVGAAGGLASIAHASPQPPADAKSDAKAETKADAKPDTQVDAKEAAARNETLLKDFVHYVLIDRADLAASTGHGLLDAKIDAAAFAKLVESSEGFTRFSRAISQGQRNHDIEPVASKLLKLYEDGKRASVRSPAQVTENIKLLTGNQQQRLYGYDRLREAGEYAMPQLLSALLQKGDPQLASEVRQVMVSMGRHAIIPLATALPDLDPVSQEQICGILGDISYPTSVPFLHQVREKSQSPQVQAAAEDAIRKITGVVNTAVTLSNRFTDLGENYYSNSPSLVSFPNDPNQLWWNFDSGAGLLMQAVATPVWHQAMAMRMAETALKEDASNAKAISLWVASNFSREIETPKDYENPAYGKDRREAMYYAVAAGPAITQSVLARGIDTGNTPLTRKSLAALEQTAGGASLWSGQGDRRPLLEALRYPNRRVQYEAALALGAAGPKQPFEGSDQVVRILGSAIRDASARFAVILTRDTSSDRVAGIADAFRGQGYTVLPLAAQLGEIAQPIADSPGIDIIVTDLPGTPTLDAISESQGSPKLRATPILALLGEDAYAQQAVRFSRDQKVRVARQGLSSQEVAESARQLLEASTGGPISAEEAEAYRAKCLSVLRDLAVSGNAILRVEDAAGPLVGSLPDAKGELKMRIAEVLSYINAKPAQTSLMDAALATKDDERIALLGKVTASARRAGNQLDPRHIDALKDLVNKSQGAEATAAAALMGALDLPKTDLVPLILGAAK